MATTQTVQLTDMSRRRKTITIAIQPVGNYVIPEPIDLTLLTNPKHLPGAFPGSVPDGIKATNQPAGYTADLIPGATLQTFTMHVYKGGTELTAVAYPAALLAEPFIFDLSGPTGKF